MLCSPQNAINPLDASVCSRGAASILPRKARNLQGTAGHALMDVLRRLVEKDSSPSCRNSGRRNMASNVSTRNLRQQGSGARCDEGAKKVYGIVVEQVPAFQQSAQETVRDHAGNCSNDRNAQPADWDESG